jgi:hypothetical protein
LRAAKPTTRPNRRIGSADLFISGVGYSTNDGAESQRQSCPG